jgi:hypothetical protein
MDHLFQSSRSKLTGQQCITNLIMGLWEHMDRIWTDPNNRYHDNTNQQVARYKMEALDRIYDEMWEKHTGLTERRHDFQAFFFKKQATNRKFKLRKQKVLGELGITIYQ